MPYQTEFRFLKQTMAKLHLQTTLLTPGEMPAEAPDLGLRHFLGQQEDYLRLFSDLPLQAEPNTIYKLTDAYLCNYLFLRLMPIPWSTSLWIPVTGSLSPPAMNRPHRSKRC